MCSTMNIIEKAATVAYKSRIGSWGDLDSLEVGNGHQTLDEYAIQFSLWALVKSPLMLGNDLLNMSAAHFLSGTERERSTDVMLVMTVMKLP